MRELLKTQRQSVAHFPKVAHPSHYLAQVSRQPEALRRAAPVAEGAAPSWRPPGLPPGHRHSGGTRPRHLRPVQARPLPADRQAGPPPRRHLQLQRDTALPQLAGGIEQVQFFAHNTVLMPHETVCLQPGVGLLVIIIYFFFLFY